MRVRFTLPSPFAHDRVRALFEAMAAALCGQPLMLVRTERVEAWDPNHAHACFVERWSAGAFSFTHTVETAEGNPRDGFPYLHLAELTWPGRTLRASDSGGSSHFSLFDVELVPTSAAEARTVREVLRRELGAERDLSSPPWETS